ncbi:uncharacterized protein LOC131250586 [Magnolia sinica]|uniref:uncharacterized protein LOC131250586 n=1 Tax=Magnolia sinica TaxID=86752 RepID=UPI00265863F2|nr:uncharacterized protein LOC131250586 [Magnolia sinica]
MELHTKKSYDIAADHTTRSIIYLALELAMAEDAAMGLVLSAAAGGRGWTTGSGMEGSCYSKFNIRLVLSLLQCCGCNVFHKLVDNLNPFHEMKCYVNPSFSYKDPTKGDMRFKFLDIDNDDDDVFPLV